MPQATLRGRLDGTAKLASRREYGKLMSIVLKEGYGLVSAAKVIQDPVQKGSRYRPAPVVRRRGGLD